MVNKHYHIVMEVEVTAGSLPEAVARVQQLLSREDSMPADVYGEGKHKRVAIQLPSRYSDGSVNTKTGDRNDE